MASLSFPSFHISTHPLPSRRPLSPTYPWTRPARRALINAPANNVFSPRKTDPRYRRPRYQSGEADLCGIKNTSRKLWRVIAAGIVSDLPRR